MQKPPEGGFAPGHRSDRGDMPQYGTGTAYCQVKPLLAICCPTGRRQAACPTPAKMIVAAHPTQSKRLLGSYVLPDVPGKSQVHADIAGAFEAGWIIDLTRKARAVT